MTSLHGPQITHPAFLHCGAFFPLSGFSGARIALIAPDGGLRRVRKAAACPKDSVSIREQAERQRELSQRLAGIVGVPEILGDGEAEGCYWFDMEYIVGTDAVRHLQIGTPDRVGSFMAQITKLIDANSKMADGHASRFSLRSKVSEKLNEIDSRTGDDYRPFTDRIRARLDDVDIILRPNFAHGDLTLENIIVDRRQQIWLIDPIPSPFNHYWIDLAKLNQDLEGRWFRRRGRSLSVGLTWTLRQRLMSYALRLDPRYGKAHSVLLALMFARILPYCSNPSDSSFVGAGLLAALDVARIE